MRATSLLVLAGLLLGGVAMSRPPEYDEAYSIFLTAGDARPDWPAGVFRPADVRGLFSGDAGFGQIARDLRLGDVHPPLYFWLLEIWRRAFGPSWLAARLLSVLSSVGALAVLAKLAGLAGIPVGPAILVTVLSYGFAYTGTVARGFALAQFLNVVGVALVFAAARGPVQNGVAGAEKKTGLLRRFMRKRAPSRDAARHDGDGAWVKSRELSAGLGGVALGAAGFANYLAVFVGLAALCWLGFTQRRRLLPALAGFVAFLPADAWFFSAQRASRAGQFESFSWPHALALLVRDSGAVLFGGLPVYAGRAGPAVALALFLLLLICVGFVIKNSSPDQKLFALTAGATPIGLLALGAVFGNTPIEIRYLAFGVPFLALLLAASLPRPLLVLYLGVQGCAILGLVTAQATMQPQALAAREAAAIATPETLVLVPFGNDGVGIPGPFIAAAPYYMRIFLLRAGAVPDLRRETRVILAGIDADAASGGAIRTVTATFSGSKCWRDEANGLVQLYTRVCHAH
jgi:hypothetical protein